MNNYFGHIINTKNHNYFNFYDNWFLLRRPLRKGARFTSRKKGCILLYHGINEGSQGIANFILLWTCPASVLADFFICVDSCTGILLNHQAYKGQIPLRKKFFFISDFTSPPLHFFHYHNINTRFLNPWKADTPILDISAWSQKCPHFEVPLKKLLWILLACRQTGQDVKMY